MNAFEKAAETQGFVPEWSRFVPKILPIAASFANHPVCSALEDDGRPRAFGL